MAWLDRASRSRSRGVAVLAGQVVGVQQPGVNFMGEGVDCASPSARYTVDRQPSLFLPTTDGSKVAVQIRRDLFPRVQTNVTRIRLECTHLFTPRLRNLFCPWLSRTARRSRGKWCARSNARVAGS